MTETERRGSSQDKQQGIARNGRLKRRQPFPTLFALLGVTAVVPLVSVGRVGAIAPNNLTVSALVGIGRPEPESKRRRSSRRRSRTPHGHRSRGSLADPVLSPAGCLQLST